MKESNTSLVVGILFLSSTLGLIVYYFYRQAITGGVTAVERLMILGPMFLLGFLAIGVAYVIGVKRLKQEKNRLATFRLNSLKVILIYGSTFLAFILWVWWDL